MDAKRDMGTVIRIESVSLMECGIVGVIVTLCRLTAIGCRYEVKDKCARVIGYLILSRCEAESNALSS